MISSLTDLVLSPFAWFYRTSCANPLVTIIVSTLAGVLAFVMGHEHWMAVLVSYAAYILVWWDESEHPVVPDATPEAAD